MTKSYKATQFWVDRSNKCQTLFIFKYRRFISKISNPLFIIGIHSTTFIIDQNGIIGEAIWVVTSKEQAMKILR